MPPLPPIGPAELETITWIIIALVIVIGIVILLRYVFSPILSQTGKKQVTVESDNINELMQELIKEIRDLRREIKELKEEMEG